jgi:hypothetical protein
VLQRAGIVCRRFAVCAQGRRPLGGQRRITQNRGAVARMVRVMDQAGGRYLGARVIQQGFENSGMKILPLRQRQIFLRGAARKLVSEGERSVGQGNHPHAQAFLDGAAGGRGDLLQKPVLDFAGYEGGDIDDGTG